MRNEKSKNPSPASAYARAGEILSLRENRLTLIEGLILLFVLAPFHITVKTVYELMLALWIPEGSTLLFVGVTVAYGVLTAALLIFLTLPVLLGFVHMAGEMVRGGRVPLVTMFHPFSSGRCYSDTLYLSSTLFARIGLAVLLVSLCRQFMFLYVEETLAVQLLSGFTAILLIVGVLLLSLRRFPTVARLDACDGDDEGVLSVPTKREAFGYGFSFFISYIPWLLLGILTLGILLLWDTLPRMAVAYFCYAEEIDEICREELETTEMQTEDAMWVPVEEAVAEQTAQPEETGIDEVASPEPEMNNMIQSEEDKHE